MSKTRKLFIGLLSALMAFSSGVSAVYAEEVPAETDIIVAEDAELTNVFTYTNSRTADYTTENFYGSSYIIYADEKLDAASASELLNELGIVENMEKYGWNAQIVCAIGDTYGEEDQKLFTDTLIDRAQPFGIKIIGIGAGADFVNEYITAKDWTVSGYMIVDAKSEADYGEIPAYVTSAEKETLSEAFANAWTEAFSKTMKLGNITGTFYTMKNSQERPFEFVPFTESAALGITRTVVTEDLDGDGVDSLWYEYIPETASAEEASAPMVLLLHGNTNDPRTQYETSGWAQLAAKEGIILVEAEWQGTSYNMDPMTENDSTTKDNDIITMLEKVFEKYPQIDQSRVYVEGLSRGSLNTMDLVLTHPEIFACGGSHSGAVIGDLMSADDFTQIIADEKDTYDMPWFFIAGTEDGFVPISEKGAENSGVLQALNLFEELNEMGHTEYADLDEEKVKWFGFTQMEDFGEVANSGSLTVMGGTIANDAGIPMLSFNAVENWGHWNYPASAELMWNFFKNYSRNTETGALIYGNETTVTVTGEEGMELAEVPEAVREIIKVEDTTVTISGKTAKTDLSIGKDGVVELADNNYVTGYSYYNVMELTAHVKQLVKALEGTAVETIETADGTVDAQYVKDLNELLDKLNSFDRSLKIRYDFEKTSANYIAENGTATLKFHVQTNGYWGYDLAGDSIIDKVTGEQGGYRENQELNNKYANFFVVDMTEKYENMYVLNDTDLQNPVLFMDDKEAFVIDVDFRGGQTFHDTLMELIGDRDLYIYITHAHGDHYNNLEYFKPEEVKGLYFETNDNLPQQEWFTQFADVTEFYVDGTKIERAGKEFEVIVMNNHTPGGSQLLDVTDRILFSGDTLGAQTFKGGTTIALSQVDNWIAQFDHSKEVLKLDTDERRIDYIIGGHTNYLNTWEFENWVYEALKEVQKNGFEATVLNPIGQNTVVVKDGKVLSKEENLACFLNGTPVPAISDEEVAHTASINIRDDRPAFQFDDVKDPERYFYQPVYWAYNHKPQITKGTSATLFSPDANVTRGQMVTFLWRLAGEPEPEGEAEFNDVKADRYFAKAIAWAAENEITTGYADGSGNFGPDDNCTREQIVTFLWRYAKKPAAEKTAEFTDTRANAYYLDALSWAAENEITLGLNDGTGRFGVGMSCTRAMAVTFLYRASN